MTQSNHQFGAKFLKKFQSNLPTSKNYLIPQKNHHSLFLYVGIIGLYVYTKHLTSVWTKQQKKKIQSQIISYAKKERKLPNCNASYANSSRNIMLLLANKYNAILYSIVHKINTECNNIIIPSYLLIL